MQTSLWKSLEINAVEQNAFAIPLLVLSEGFRRLEETLNHCREDILDPRNFFK